MEWWCDDVQTGRHFEDDGSRGHPVVAFVEFVDSVLRVDVNDNSACDIFGTQFIGQLALKGDALGQGLGLADRKVLDDGIGQGERRVVEGWLASASRKRTRKGPLSAAPLFWTVVDTWID